MGESFPRIFESISKDSRVDLGPNQRVLRRSSAKTTDSGSAWPLSPLARQPHQRLKSRLANANRLGPSTLAGHTYRTSRSGCVSAWGLDYDRRRGQISQFNKINGQTGSRRRRWGSIFDQHSHHVFRSERPKEHRSRERSGPTHRINVDARSVLVNLPSTPSCCRDDFKSSRAFVQIVLTEYEIGIGE